MIKLSINSPIITQNPIQIYFTTCMFLRQTPLSKSYKVNENTMLVNNVHDIMHSMESRDL